MNDTANKFKEYFIYFSLYSVIGWLYETVLEVAIYQTGFSNRGFLLGPYLPVYGFGALLFIFILTRLRENPHHIGRVNINPLLIFIGTMLIATVTELIASYILEGVIGYWLWDYTHYSFNLEGRIALNPSVRFGIGGLLFMYVLQPIFKSFTRKMGTKKISLLFWGLFIVIGIDLCVKLISLI